MWDITAWVCRVFEYFVKYFQAVYNLTVKMSKSFQTFNKLTFVKPPLCRVQICFSAHVVIGPLSGPYIET